VGRYEGKLFTYLGQETRARKNVTTRHEQPRYTRLLLQPLLAREEEERRWVGQSDIRSRTGSEDDGSLEKSTNRRSGVSIIAKAGELTSPDLQNAPYLASLGRKSRCPWQQAVPGHMTGYGVRLSITEDIFPKRKGKQHVKIWVCDVLLASRRRPNRIHPSRWRTETLVCGDRQKPCRIESRSVRIAYRTWNGRDRPQPLP